MIRRIIAVIAGATAAVLLVMLIQKLGHSLYPPPEGLDLTDQEFMHEYVASLPWGPLAFVIASYVVATLVGGWVGAAIAGEYPFLYAGIIAVFVLAGTISTILMIPHPTWFTVTAIVGIVLAALAAAMLASGGRGPGKPI